MHCVACSIFQHFFAAMLMHLRSVASILPLFWASTLWLLRKVPIAPHTKAPAFQGYKCQINPCKTDDRICHTYCRVLWAYTCDGTVNSRSFYIDIDYHQYDTCRTSPGQKAKYWVLPQMHRSGAGPYQAQWSSADLQCWCCLHPQTADLSANTSPKPAYKSTTLKQLCRRCCEKGVDLLY